MPYQQYALVTARSTSTRLPNKCFQPIADNATLVEVVLRRAKKLGCPVVLCTTSDPSDDDLARVAQQESVLCFRGALRNKIHRWASCFKAFHIDSALLVDGDDPTFDYDVGKRALALLARGQAHVVKADQEMTPGFFTYGISSYGIEALLSVAQDPHTDTDVITRFLEKADLHTEYVEAYPFEQTGQSVRLTVDYPEDVEFYKTLHRKISYLAPSPDIVTVALQHKFSDINWFRQDEFLKNQQSFNERVQ